MSKTIIKDVSIKDLVEDNQSLFGNYTNQKRHMPHRLDGLKPSYRRMIWTALELPDKLTKVATLAGMCGGKYSPHAPESLPPVVSEMVGANIFQGQGAHGSKSIYKDWNIGAAAGRYIEAKVKSEWRKAMEPLIPLVPKSKSDMGFFEPDYLPTPIPMSLLYGSLGIGIGIRSKVPFFSAKSLIKAYKEDNPQLLKANGDIVINKSKSELQQLWDTGIGRVGYMFYIDENAVSRDGKTKGYYMYGDPRFIQATLTKNLEGDRSTGDPEDWGWIDKGLVTMRDESHRKTGKKVFFTVKSKQKGKDKVTLEMLRKELEVMRYCQDSFKLAVTNGKYTEVIGLKDWIKGCYENYNKLVKDYKLAQLAKLQLKKDVAIHAKDIVDQIRKKDSITKDQIVKNLGISIEVVNEALKKSISVLMKFNKDKELDTIKAEVIRVSKLTPEDFYESLLKL